MAPTLAAAPRAPISLVTEGSSRLGTSPGKSRHGPRPRAPSSQQHPARGGTRASPALDPRSWARPRQTGRRHLLHLGSQRAQVGRRQGGGGGAGSRGIPPLRGGRWGHVGGSAGPASRPEPGRKAGSVPPGPGSPSAACGVVSPKASGPSSPPGPTSWAPQPRAPSTPKRSCPRAGRSSGTLAASPGPRTSPGIRGEAAHVPAQ